MRGSIHNFPAQRFTDTNIFPPGGERPDGPYVNEKEKGSRNETFPDTTKADVIAPDHRIVPAAVGNADVAGNVLPGPTAQNAELTTCRPGGVLRRDLPVIALVPPVIHPLPHVPQHVAQPEPVGTFLPDFVHAVAVFGQALQKVCLVSFFPNSFAVPALTPTVVRIPGNFIHITITGCGAPGPCRILPLGFRRQPPARPLTLIP